MAIMKNPNGPSIEEKEQMAEYLRERGEDYEAGWNASLNSVRNMVKDWKQQNNNDYINVDYVLTIIEKRMRNQKRICGACQCEVTVINGKDSCGCNPPGS